MLTEESLHGGRGSSVGPAVNKTTTPVLRIDSEEMEEVSIFEDEFISVEGDVIGFFNCVMAADLVASCACVDMVDDFIGSSACVDMVDDFIGSFACIDMVDDSIGSFASIDMVDDSIGSFGCIDMVDDSIGSCNFVMDILTVGIISSEVDITGSSVFEKILFVIGLLDINSIRSKPVVENAKEVVTAIRGSVTERTCDDECSKAEVEAGIIVGFATEDVGLRLGLGDEDFAGKKV